MRLTQNRIMILDSLIEKDLTTREIADILYKDQVTVATALATMVKLDLIKVIKKGRTQTYSITEVGRNVLYNRS